MVGAARSRFTSSTERGERNDETDSNRVGPTEKTLSLDPFKFIILVWTIPVSFISDFESLCVSRILKGWVEATKKNSQSLNSSFNDWCHRIRGIWSRHHSRGRLLVTLFTHCVLCLCAPRGRDATLCNVNQAFGSFSPYRRGCFSPQFEFGRFEQRAPRVSRVADENRVV